MPFTLGMVRAYRIQYSHEYYKEYCELRRFGFQELSILTYFFNWRFISFVWLFSSLARVSQLVGQIFNRNNAKKTSTSLLLFATIVFPILKIKFLRPQPGHSSVIMAVPRVKGHSLGGEICQWKFFLPSLAELGRSGCG